MPAKTDLDRRSIRLTWLMVLLAVLTFEAAAGAGERSGRATAAIVLAEALAVLAGAWLFGRWGGQLLPSSQSQRIVVLSLATGAFLVEVGFRSLTRTELPLELWLLAWFRNGLLSLAALAQLADVRRLCTVLAVFLVIFASALSAQWWLQGWVLLFAVAGIWWLMGGYWDSLRGQLTATSATQLPLRWWLVLPVMIVAALGVVPATGLQTRMLWGFVPSSGGTGGSSETARHGVGDGDALVAGTEDIRSFAPIEDAPFMTSHEPSLYDLFDDTYDEPVRPQNQDRAISLPPQLSARQKDHHLAESKKAGKEFSTLRKVGQRPAAKMRNLDSNALLYVKGRVPLHLKLEVFDRYDGVDWLPEDLPDLQPRLFFERLHERPWLRTEISPSLEIYGVPETHALKIIGMDTNRVPSPTQLLGVHIDQLDRPDLFAWAQPGVLRMEREKLPALTAMHVQSRVVDPRRLIAARLPQFGGPENYRQFSDDQASQQVAELAQAWTRGVPAGQPQVDAIVSRLRTDYVLDPTARAAVECRHTVADFLLRRQRGPDYEFAGAAVWLLRAAGYPARLVSGLYARPDRFDRRAQHTAILAEDVHFWVEVYAARDQWIPVEPTPGYELLKPPPTLWEQLQAGLAAVGRWLWQHAVAVLAITVGLGVVVVQRRLLADFLQTLWWRIAPARSEREFVLRSVRLLSARACRAGFSAPEGTTRTRWLRGLALAAEPEQRHSLERLARLAEWAGFAPQDLPSPSDSIFADCQSAVFSWNWRAARRQTGAAAGPPFQLSASGQAGPRPFAAKVTV